MFTYKATNTQNGKFYVGSTRDFDKRKKGHLASNSNYPFQNALRQNPEAFEWEVVEDDSEEPILEQALLDMWFGTEMCYNLNPVADHPPSWEGKKHKESTKKKQRDAALLRGPLSSESAKKGVETRIKNGNLYPTEETREKMKNSHTGKKHSAESRLKRSQKLKGKPNESARGSSWWINLHTQETRMFQDNPGVGWIKGRKLK